MSSGSGNFWKIAASESGNIVHMVRPAFLVGLLYEGPQCLSTTKDDAVKTDVSRSDDVFS